MLKTKILISGGGPAGLLLAACLVERPNYDIHIYEKRPDPESFGEKEIRTYPIALQHRGLESIRQHQGLEASLEAVGKWMVGVTFYTGKKARSIIREPSLSVERNDIVRSFLKHLRQTNVHNDSSLSFHFECTIDDVSLPKKAITTSDGKEESFDYLVAADGACSIVRTRLAEDPQAKLSFDLNQLPDSYRSLYLDLKSDDGCVELKKDHVSGCMVGDIRMITVPVKPTYSSGTFIFPKDQDPFQVLQSPREVKAYLQTKLMQLSKLVSDKEAAEILDRPSSNSWTVKCNKLTVVGEDKKSLVVLIGDAAHAVSPALGQGCNSALQDVMILNGYLKQYDEDWDKALVAYNDERLKDAHAVYDLSEYATPRTPFMRLEWMIRTILRNILPTILAKMLFRPLPFDLLYNKDLSYSQILSQSNWWVQRVKRSMEKSKN